MTLLFLWRAYLLALLVPSSNSPPHKRYSPPPPLNKEPSSMSQVIIVLVAPLELIPILIGWSTQRKKDHTKGCHEKEKKKYPMSIFKKKRYTRPQFSKKKNPPSAIQMLYSKGMSQFYHLFGASPGPCCDRADNLHDPIFIPLISQPTTSLRQGRRFSFVSLTALTFTLALRTPHPLVYNHSVTLELILS